MEKQETSLTKFSFQFAIASSLSVLSEEQVSFKE